MRIRDLKSGPLILVAAGGLVVGLAMPAAAGEASHLINGKTIKPHTIAGNRLEDNTVTGQQIKESTLGTVPEAHRLDGYTHHSMSSMSLPVQSAYLTGDASFEIDENGGVALRAAGSSGMTIGFMVPPDHNPADPLYADLVYSGSPGCGWSVTTEGLTGPVQSQGAPELLNGGWSVPGTNNYAGTITTPAGSATAFTATFKWMQPSPVGQMIQFALTRYGDDAADTCPEIDVYGLQIRY
jgi:hypothetical protein